MSNLNVEQGDLRKSALSVKRIAIMAVFIALSAVGALIKIPSPAHGASAYMRHMTGTQPPCAW